MDDAETTLLGSVFEILAAATGKAWLPIVETSWTMVGRRQMHSTYIELQAACCSCCGAV